MNAEVPLTASPWVTPWEVEDGNSLAARLYEQTFGFPHDGVWSAPGSVMIAGEHSDYTGGRSLPVTLDHRTYIAAGLRDDSEVCIISHVGMRPGERRDVIRMPLENLEPSTVPAWAFHAVGTIIALQERGYDGQGLNLALDSCVPVGAGLGDSASVSVATARATEALWRLSLANEAGREILAEACRSVEIHPGTVASGGAYQYAALFEERGHALELDFSTEPPHRTLASLGLADYGLTLFLTLTGVDYWLDTDRMTQRRRECEEAAQQLGVPELGSLQSTPEVLESIAALEDPTLRKRARHVVTETERVRTIVEELASTAPAHERFLTIGAQLFKANTSLAVDFDLAFKEAELAVRTAWQIGALGARVVDGGGGGCTLTLARTSSVNSITEAVVEAFRASGLNTPRFLAVYST